LLLTGYEQVRSVAAAIAGDTEAADNVQLVLPETGVCSVPVTAVDAGRAACCGSPAASQADADPRIEMLATASYKAGCGCGEAA
ncbi:MAG: flavoprotein, partial [Ancalomicrobiaceae bacterium]|nr:flavoprotein [Ancalomicrobiaceae bacterium]